MCSYSFSQKSWFSGKWLYLKGNELLLEIHPFWLNRDEGRIRVRKFSPGVGGHYYVSSLEAGAFRHQPTHLTWQSEGTFLGPNGHRERFGDRCLGGWGLTCVGSLDEMTSNLDQSHYTLHMMYKWKEIKKGVKEGHSLDLVSQTIGRNITWLRGGWRNAEVAQLLLFGWWLENVHPHPSPTPPDPMLLPEAPLMAGSTVEMKPCESVWVGDSQGEVRLKHQNPAQNGVFHCTIY